MRIGLRGFTYSGVAPIRYYNRSTQSFETEQVYGEGFLRWTYGSPLGAIALHAFVKRPFFSAWYGWRMNAAKSAARIAPFIKRYGVDATEFADAPEWCRFIPANDWNSVVSWNRFSNPICRLRRGWTRAQT